jgi:hypothetical protein
MSKRWLTAVATVFAVVLGLPSAASAAPTWLAPQSLSSASHSETGSVMTGDGTVAVAAVRVAGSGAKQIVATVRPSGGEWGPMQVLDSTAPDGVAFLMWVGASPTGQISVAYRKTGGAGVLVSTLRADGTFSPATSSPADMHEAGARAIGYDAAGTLYAAKKPALGSDFGSIEVLRADGSRATEYFRLAGWSASDSELVLNVAPDGHYTVLYTAQEQVGGSECATRRLFSAEGTATNVGAPTLILERAPVTYAPPIATPCMEQPISNVSAVRLTDGTLLAAYGTLTPHSEEPFGAGELHVALISRVDGGAWSAPQRFALTLGALRTKLTRAGATAVLTLYDGDDFNAVSVRGAGGTWSAPRKFGTKQALANVLGVPDGSSQLVWSDLASGDVFAQPVAADGTLGAAPRVIFAKYQNFSLVRDVLEVATDGQGNGVLAGPTASSALGYVAFDGAAPILDTLAVPGAGVAGAPLSFPTTAFDVWGPVTLDWTFGDGTTGTGGEHTYGNAGRFPVTVTATDEAGNTSTKRGEVAIAAAPVAAPAPGPGPAPALDTTAPRFTTKPKVAPTKPTVKKAATLTFGLSEAASVVAVVQQKTKGIKRTAKGKCAKAPKTKPKGARSCTLLVTRTTKKGAFKVGKGTIKLPKTLKAGSYTIALTATDAAGNTGKATASFTVRKAKAKR